ncbi:MAG: hypothetical protein MI741_13255, partial [Rhodospirillales bacterium]|nr:hypothetical protein [Rhodospirillales bacterium]
MFTPVKPAKRPRIGLYQIGLAQYWNQFEGLRERLIDYGEFIAERIGQVADVTNLGMVDTEALGRRAAEQFNAANVDLIFCHVATYATSATHIAIANRCNVPVVLLNLQ